jgi:hypothetical protein
MIIPGMGEGTDIIDVDFWILNITENIVHDLLSIIRGALKFP